MKKSVSIIASILMTASLAGATAPLDNADEEPPHKTVALERQANQVSRSSKRPAFEEMAKMKRAMQEAMFKKRQEHLFEAEKRRAERAAAKEASRKAAEHKAELAREAAEKARKQKRERAEKRRATQSKPKYSAPSGNIKQYAASLVGPGQFQCLDAIFNRESGWNPSATNPSSGAYGIPQALPGSKMASAGSDWRTNPYTQVRWGVSYIKSRYGTPCNAWAHSQQTGWY